MSITVSAAHRKAFYSAALIGLRALEKTECSSRRFGPDADARWNSFRGHLGTAERIDLLIRDAAVNWSGAFSPASIFGLPGLATDEPFGPDWAALPEHDSNRLWADESLQVSIQSVADTLGIKQTTIDLPNITASTRLVVGGGSAILAVATHFDDNTGLSWSDQVLVVAEEPAHRQLAGLMAPLLRANQATRMILPLDDATAALRNAGFSTGGIGVVSQEASGTIRDFVRRATGG